MNRRQLFRLLSGGAVLALVPALSACERDYRYPPHPRYNYYYYPHEDVYFHIHTGYYYYFIDGLWIRSRTLPRYIYLRPAYRRTLYIAEPQPYLRNREHRRQFGMPEIDREMIRERERERELSQRRRRTQPAEPQPPRRVIQPRPRLSDSDRNRRDAEDRREREQLQQESLWRRRRG